MTKRRITSVAIKFNGKVHALPAPNRHHHVIRMIGGCGGPSTEGFLDDSGRFLTRTQAMDLARENGQLNRRPGDEHYQGPELYSEDLW